MNSLRTSQKTQKTSNNQLRTWFDKNILGTIRNKIIFPFLILTLGVTMMGTYVVVTLVASNAQDRLDTTLLENTRSANDSIVGVENENLSDLNLIYSLEGIREIIASKDIETLDLNLLAVAGNQDVYLALITDEQGVVLSGINKLDDGSHVTQVLAGQDISSVPAVQKVIARDFTPTQDKFAGTFDLNNSAYLLTTSPINGLDGQLLGVLVVGSPFEDILLEIKGSLLVDLTIYDSAGKVVATTFTIVDEASESFLEIEPEFYENVMTISSVQTLQESKSINRRQFQTMYTPLVIQQAPVLVLGVSLPSELIDSLAAVNRVSMTVIFSVVAVMVVVVGYTVAQNLSDPIRRLAYSARVVSAGDLTHRSGVKTKDEIGTLGETFDNMTAQLDAQTKALQTAFMEQEREAANLQAILYSVGDGTLVMDNEGRVTQFNPLARDIIDEYPAQWDAILQDLSEQARTGQRVQRRVELPNQWIDTVATQVITTSGEEIVGVVVTMHDVSDQVLNEKMRTAFILQMSHELYTPLTTFKGYAELALTMLKDQPELAGQFLTNAMGSANVLNELIGKLLDVSHMIRGGFEIKRWPADLDAAFQSAVDNFQHIFKMRDLSVSTHLGRVGFHDVAGDKLQWAAERLIENASMYTLVGGKVDIASYIDGGYIVFRVRDTGVGISESDQQHLFREFFRGKPVAPDGTEIDVRGTGLGLFIVEQVVRAHGGNVTYTSEQGVGSEFVMMVPVAPSTEKDIRQIVGLGYNYYNGSEDSR